MDQLSQSWHIDELPNRQLLSWAARLHEIGLHIAHSHFERHGAYLLEHADMPGFPTEEQQIIARLVGGHRGKLDSKSFADVTRSWSRRIKRLAVVLRLAALFNRGRSDAPVPEIVVRAKGRRVSISVSEGWADLNPLTWTDLTREQRVLEEVGIELKLVEKKSLAV